MTMTSVDLNQELLARARELADVSSDQAVIDLALRQFIAFKQKGEMIDAISKMEWLAEGLDAPVIEYPVRK